MIRFIRISVVLCICVFAIVSCGDDDDSSDSAATPTASDARETATRADDTDIEPTATERADSSTATAPDTQRTSEATPTDSRPAPGETFAYGWNVAPRGDDQAETHNERTADLVLDSGFGWVRFMLPWDQFERQNNQWDPLPYDRMVEAFSSRGIDILIVVAKAPEWARSGQEGQFLADVDEFEEFMAFVADRYRGRVQAWEVWNEQNLAHEFGDHVDAPQYVEMLKAGYNGVKAGDPEALVLFGGLTPNGVMDEAIAIDDVKYLEQAYAYNGGEIRKYFDILGVHLNSTHNPPGARFPLADPEHEGWNDHPSFFFRRAEALRQVMVEAGDGEKPVWITEFGWTTENLAVGYEYGANNTEQEVAQYLTGAIEIARAEWPWTTGAFVWNLNWSTLTDPDDEKHPWSAVNADWSPRPAYEALSALPKGD